MDSYLVDLMELPMVTKMDATKAVRLEPSMVYQMVGHLDDWKVDL